MTTSSGAEIAQGNKLIRQFMNPDAYSMPKAKPYHSSWDLLMPVVLKMEQLAHRTSFTIMEWDIEIYHSGFLKSMGDDRDLSYFSFKRNGRHFGEEKLFILWEGIVQFIKWYNTQNTQQP